MNMNYELEIVHLKKRRFEVQPTSLSSTLSRLELTAVRNVQTAPVPIGIDGHFRVRR